MPHALMLPCPTRQGAHKAGHREEASEAILGRSTDPPDTSMRTILKAAAGDSIRVPDSTPTSSLCGETLWIA